MLLLAAIASYLVIAVGVSLATDAELLGKDVARQAFFFVVTLTAILGGRWLLERIGVEDLLKWLLVILMASCAVILASPLLREIGVLPEYRLIRFTGTFTDPNDAGFIACITATLSLALLYNGLQRRLAYPALALGYAAAFTTFSSTAFIVMGVTLLLFLALNVRHLRQDLFRIGLSVLGVAGILVYFTVNPQQLEPFERADNSSPTEALRPAICRQKPGRRTIAVYPNRQRQRRSAWPGFEVRRMKKGEWGTSSAPTWSTTGSTGPTTTRYNPGIGRGPTPDGTMPTRPTTPPGPTSRGALSYKYTPADVDGGRFLRGYVYYEKNGETYRAQTVAIGPIMGEPASQLEQVRDTVATIRGESKTFGAGGLSQRIDLWELGGRKSPGLAHRRQRSCTSSTTWRAPLSTTLTARSASTTCT